MLALALALGEELALALALGEELALVLVDELTDKLKNIHFHQSLYKPLALFSRCQGCYKTARLFLSSSTLLPWRHMSHIPYFCMPATDHSQSSQCLQGMNFLHCKQD